MDLIQQYYCGATPTSMDATWLLQQLTRLLCFKGFCYRLQTTFIKNSKSRWCNWKKSLHNGFLWYWHIIKYLCKISGSYEQVKKSIKIHVKSMKIFIFIHLTFWICILKFILILRIDIWIIFFVCFEWNSGQYFVHCDVCDALISIKAQFNVHFDVFER